MRWLVENRTADNIALMHLPYDYWTFFVRTHPTTFCSCVPQLFVACNRGKNTHRMHHPAHEQFRKLRDDTTFPTHINSVNYLSLSLHATLHPKQTCWLQQCSLFVTRHFQRCLFPCMCTTATTETHVTLHVLKTANTTADHTLILLLEPAMLIKSSVESCRAIASFWCHCNLPT